MLTLAISALSFASSPITQAPAGAASEVDCDAMCGKDSACSAWSSCTDGADDAGAMAQVLGENCYMPWPPSGWPPSWVCPTAAGPPALGGDTEGKDCSTLTEPGGPAAEGIPSNYWGAIAMDNNIIDKSDDIVAQLRAQDYQKGTLKEYQDAEELEEGSGKVWGKTIVEWDALGFICQVPLDGTATCNVRPPASTARPAATASTPSPAALHPHAPHHAPAPRCSLGVTPKRRTACATTAGAGVRVSGPRTPPPRASSNFLAKRRFARATARTASTAARGRRSRTRGRPTLAECATAPPPASPLPPPLPASGLGATSCGRAGV